MNGHLSKADLAKFKKAADHRRKVRAGELSEKNKRSKPKGKYKSLRVSVLTAMVAHVNNTIDKLAMKQDAARAERKAIESEVFFRRSGKHYDDIILVGRTRYRITGDTGLQAAGGARMSYHAPNLILFLTGQVKNPFGRGR